MCSLLKTLEVSFKEVACCSGFLSHHLKLKVGRNSTNRAASRSSQHCPDRKRDCAEGCTQLVRRVCSGLLEGWTQTQWQHLPQFSHVDFNIEGKEFSLSSRAIPLKEIGFLVQNITLPLPYGVLLLKNGWYLENVAGRPTAGVNCLRNKFLPFQRSLATGHQFNQHIIDDFDKLSSKIVFVKISGFPTCYWAGQNWEFYTMCNSCWIFFRKSHYVHCHFLPTSTKNKNNWWGLTQMTENLVVHESELQICMWRWRGTVQNHRDASDRRCSKLTMNLRNPSPLRTVQNKKALIKWMDFIKEVLHLVCLCSQSMFGLSRKHKPTGFLLNTCISGLQEFKVQFRFCIVSLQT